MISAKKILIIAILSAITLISCSSGGNIAKRPCNDFVLLETWMTGSFSSQEQSEADSNYHDIRLEMKRIWRGLPDGYWIYVEQALADSLNQPYRQRVYYISQITDSTFKTAVYTFKEPLRFAGAWKENKPLASLTPDSLIKSDGCSIIIKKNDRDEFVGSTVDKHCKSNLRGASYATSEIRIREDQLISWDRGFDSDGNQVWGTETGSYIFKRINMQADSSKTDI